MGGGTYNTVLRSSRSATLGYTSVDYRDKASMDAVFTQQKERKAHESMLPLNVAFREARDSEAHPKSTPIQLYLDVTGSMGMIPAEMIKDGLPTLMSKLIQNGVEDAALMFGAIGDHEYDRYPLQIGQFESGDAELDLWLTRTYLESGGGGNVGESYLLAWYFAANHIKTDAWDKRNQKGFVITIGDEACLPRIPANALKGIMGSTFAGQGSPTAQELLDAARERNHVFHIFVKHGRRGDPGELNSWKALMGQDLIITEDQTKIPSIISELIISKTQASGSVFTPTKADPIADESKEML